ncbi:hypothetical protein EVAR_28861_1 [Eumeta japonica]|uniref:Uncharacterized protein n=1 Tax=Eumeta variegata TaxID=151549 RepID=A0A4C1YM15_EUMVA|nr:hypothetical protein EVAR_28861_1 [Eumeta japonica]
MSTSFNPKSERRQGRRRQHDRKGRRAPGRRARPSDAVYVRSIPEHPPLPFPVSIRHHMNNVHRNALSPSPSRGRPRAVINVAESAEVSHLELRRKLCRRRNVSTTISSPCATVIEQREILSERANEPPDKCRVFVFILRRLQPHTLLMDSRELPALAGARDARPFDYFIRPYKLSQTAIVLGCSRLNNVQGSAGTVLAELLRLRGSQHLLAAPQVFGTSTNSSVLVIIYCD